MNDRYQIISTLSTGGTGTVQQAWDKSQNRDVALKRLRGEGVQVDALLREARALYALRHPHIVTILEYGSDEEGAFLVMELIKGESLEHRLAHGPLNLEDFKALVTQSLEAIGVAHDASLIHRDLKPENIILPWNRDGHFEIKIIDFGLSQYLPPEGGQQDSLVGSIHFMAPEQFGSGYIDARTDLYALGCIYYQALTGQLAFPGEQKTHVITAHLYPPQIPLAELRPDLSDALCAWVEQLLSVQPNARPQSAAQALKNFRQLGRNLQVQTAANVAEEPAIMVLEEEELPEVILEADPEPELIVASAEEPTLLAYEPEPLPEPELEPIYTASTGENTQPILQTSIGENTQPILQASIEPEPPTTRRTIPSQPRPVPPRKSSLNIIITAFVVILIAQFAVISYFKYAGREGREKRLEELSTSEQPQGSDVDVRTLLEFLEDPTHQDQAVKALTKLQGGDYIDSILLEHLEKVKKYPVCAKLIQIIGQRRIADGFDTLLPLTSDGRGDVRKAAWTALGRITPATKLPEILNLIPQSSSFDKEVIEKALTAVVEASPERKKATQHVLKAYHNATDQAETRALLFNVLTRIGGDNILSVVTEAIADPSEQVRLAAIMVLAEYPTHEPLAAITTRFPQETNETCRTYLLLAARELINLPGPSSQQTLFLHAQSLYANAKDTVEKRYVLSVMSRIISPGTATFFEDFAKSADASLRGEARQLAKAFREKLDQVVAIPLGEKATLPADKADYRLGSTISLEEGALIHWTQEGDWASWLVELPRNGEYEVAVYQAHANNQLGTYEILMAGETLLTSVVQTASPTDYKGFVVGKFSVPQAGIYRLRIRAKTVPAEGELFRVQHLTVKAL
ncbi:MAG: protein kinase [Prosthecobacter sp.]|nr:protein kinase [Prosthecobacter sp.]